MQEFRNLIPFPLTPIINGINALKTALADTIIVPSLETPEAISIPPVSIGIDNHTKSVSFLEQNPEILFNYYEEYSNSKSRRLNTTYVEVQSLRSMTKGFSSGEDISQFTIELAPNRWEIPQNLQRHKEAAIFLFAEQERLWRHPDGTYFNDESVRISKWDSVQRRIHMQRATYFDQVATNLCLDWASLRLNEQFPEATIRNDIEGRTISRGLKPLDKSILANTLGVATYLFSTTDKCLLIVQRSKNVAVMRSKLHCSASGVFDTVALGKPNAILSFNIFLDGMRKEINEELTLMPHEYDLFPLAFARELPRGGKPQIFFGAETELTIADLHRRMRQAEHNREYRIIRPDDFESTDPRRGLLIGTTPPTPDEYVFFTYEGWMGLLLMASYLAGDPQPIVMD